MAVRIAAGEVAGPEHPRACWHPLDAVLLAALAVAAAVLRIGPIGPSSLWLDDAWTALVVRAESWGQAVDLTITAPGFGLLLRAWLSLVGFSETAAQLPALAFAVLGPPTVYLVARRARLGRAASLLAGALLVLAPAHVTFASRVKQYTLDALLATALLGLAWRVLEDPADRGRWAWLVAVSVAATVVSAAVAPVVAGAFAAGLVAARRAQAPLRTGLLATGAYGLAGLGWYLAFLRPSVSPALRDYWSGEYIDASAGAVAAGTDLVRGLAGVLAAFSALPPLLVAAVLGAAVIVAISSRRVEVGVLLAGPVVVAIALAAARLAPLGGGRTDVYLLPGLALVCAFAVDALADRRIAGGVVVLALLASVVPGPLPRPYPEHDVRPLVAQVEAELGAGDVLLVYSATRWAYGLYTSSPVSFRDDPTQGTGFDVAVADPRVRILAPQRDQPHRYAPEVAVGTRGADGVWLLASGWREDLVVLERLVGQQGLRQVSRTERPGGLLVRWER